MNTPYSAHQFQAKTLADDFRHRKKPNRIRAQHLKPWDTSTLCCPQKAPYKTAKFRAGA